MRFGYTKPVNTLRHIPPVLVWVAGLAVACLSVLGLLWRWCAVIAGVLTLLVVTVQYKNQGNTTINFRSGNWVKEGAEYRFSAGRHHGKGF
jgi:hypothetical protein